MYKQTSMLAYKTVKPSIGYKQNRVLMALEEIQPANDKQIAEHLGWPINTVTNRRGELVELGKVEEAGKGPDPISNRTVMYWKKRVEERDDADTY